MKSKKKKIIPISKQNLTEMQDSFFSFSFFFFSLSLSLLLVQTYPPTQNLFLPTRHHRVVLCSIDGIIDFMSSVLKSSFPNL